MKFYVRHEGQELMFPSFKDFQSMYRMKFIGEDDLVRRESSERWVRVGDLPELRSIHLYDRNQRSFTQIMWLMVGAAAVLVLLQLFFRFKR